MDELEKKIEEAAFKFCKDSKNIEIQGFEFNAFCEGAKSEEAKAFHIQGMYTEEEVKELLECYESHFRCHISQYCDPQDVQNFEEFFEQNKKK